jgi:hypothetical protein
VLAHPGPATVSTEREEHAASSAFPESCGGPEEVEGGENIPKKETGTIWWIIAFLFSFLIVMWF